LFIKIQKLALKLFNNAVKQCFNILFASFAAKNLKCYINHDQHTNVVYLEKNSQVLSGVTNTQWCILMIQFLITISLDCTFLVSNHQYQVSTNIILDCIAKALSCITNTRWCILMIQFLIVISHYCTLLLLNHQYQASTNIILECITKELSGKTNSRWCILMIWFLMVICHYCTLLVSNHQC